MQLSDEAMVEIGKVRERLMDYKRSIQPYPVEPEAEAPEPKPQIIEHRHSDMSKQDFALLRDLEGRVKYLQGKLTERQPRKQPKPSGYKGIK